MFAQKFIAASPLGDFIIGIVVNQINGETLIVSIEPFKIKPLCNLDFFNH